ncbi:MAG: LL-diaminopimelate aminotransferase [Clostridiales bacterium]|nr:MAG: LL-diaminopimelate aminotransferase [Clostridiales bacterium]
MVKTNPNFKLLVENYLFADIAKRVAEFSAAGGNGQRIIKMGIGDVTLPLAPAVVAALSEAVGEMGVKETFQGYPPYDGYPFLKNAISEYYRARGIDIDPSEVYVGDGAKSDVGNITDLFSNDNVVLVPDPVYPVYVDSNLMLNREIRYIDANEENGYLPLPDGRTVGDILYLCSPNNPTGAVYTREQLAQWVNFARERGSVILFDAAYEAFITDPSLPRSIFEIEGAAECAIELCSFSKTAGFTGTRCGYTVIPNRLMRDGVSLGKLWLRRQSTKYNGTAYIIQRGAAAVFTEAGHRQTREAIRYYLDNARIIMDFLKKKDISFTGGENSPYIWLKCPRGMESWEFFDYLLKSAAVVGTPGSGFGKNGNGRFRLTSFGNREDTLEAVERLDAIF